METITAIAPSKEIEEVIRKVESGFFNETIRELKDSNFGIFYPAMVGENGEVVPIPNGYSQLESNLEISLADKLEGKGVKVGWYMEKSGLGCFHCSQHAGNPPTCVHCENHRHGGGEKRIESELLLGAEGLDPACFEDEVGKYQSVLNSVGAYGFGLYVLHGHNNEHAFTKLPKGILSVIVNGKTEFLHKSQISNSEGFVPNMWRYENGKCQAAGGFM